MAVPKRRTSRPNTGHRRAQWRAAAPMRWTA
ncbi:MULTISPECIES: 50S ribosomal protein L32 [unclassified Micromonospora]